MAVSEEGSAGYAAGRLGGISRVGSIGGLLGGAVLVDWLGFGPALGVMACLSMIAVPVGWFGFAPIPSMAAPETQDGGGSRVISLLGFAHGAVGAGLVLATLGAVLDERAGRSGLVTATTLTGSALALRFAIEGLAAGRLGAISDKRGVRVTSTGAFAAGAIALTAAALAPSVLYSSLLSSRSSSAGRPSVPG